MPDNHPSHPSPERLAAFDRGRLPTPLWDEVERHLAGCDECCRRLEDLPADPDALLHSLKAAVTGSGVVPTQVPPELIGHPRYHVLEFLGAGGMGTVFRAKHLLMDRIVALKVIRKDLMARPGVVERFRQEVKAAARLAHPNIVAAHDAEQVGELHLLVMEYVEGANLERLVATSGPFAVEYACSVIQQAARGLQHAFERGITHRDVKPSNLLLAKDGQVKVMDFGLARVTDAADAQTPAGAVVGTPDYLAPDQAQNPQRADVRADIYSLGCVLYFLLTGRPPFSGATVLEKLLAHQTQASPALAKQRADVPAELSTLVGRMLAKAPVDRPQTPAEVAEALEPFVSSSTSAYQPFFNPSPSLAQLPTCLPVAPSLRVSRRRWPLLLAGTGMLLFVGALTVFLGFRHEENERADGPGTQLATRPASAASLPERLPPPLSREQMHEQALAWFANHNCVKPEHGFMKKTTGQFNDRFRRQVGFIYEVSENLVDSRRPTIVLVRCGAIHVFELTNSQARNWPHGSGGLVTSDFPDRDVLDPAPAIELSQLQFDNALQVNCEQPVTGSVQVRGVAALKGPLWLRFTVTSGGLLYHDYFRLPEPLPKGRFPCAFSFARLKDKDKPWRPGPHVLCLEVCSLQESEGKTIATVRSNSVAAVVNVLATPP